MRRLCLILCWLAGAAPGLAQAHLVAAGQGAIRLVDRSAFVLLSVPVGALSGFDDNRDGLIDRAEIAAHRSQLNAQVSALLELRSGDERGLLTFSDLLLPGEDGAPAAEVAAMRTYTWSAHPARLAVRLHLFHSDAARGRQLALRVIDGTRTEAAMLDAARPAHEFFAGGLATFASFARAGVEHILAGPDHLLFLLTILAVGVTWRYWLTVVTCFTVAHSITLAASAFEWVAAPPRLIEPLIAASIVVVAVDNLVRGRRALAQRAPLVFSFGLLHGLGIASGLAELGLSDQTRLAGLAGFNLGVEAGQLIFVGGLLAVLAALRALPLARWAYLAPRLASICAAVVGTFWLVERGLV